MYSPQQKIGVLGSGIVGQMMADAFLREGHPVMLGTRDVAKDSVVKWQKAHPKALTGSFEQTAAFGDILVLAVSGLNAEGLVGQLEASIGAKVVIDITNPIAAAPPVHGVLAYFTTFDDSLMERLQRKAARARFVKAFNSVGNLYFYKPSFGGVQPTMFVCGNDADAKDTVTQILQVFGWEWADMGPVEAARAIEPLCMLWCIPGLAENKWTHAFKLLKA